MEGVSLGGVWGRGWAAGGGCLGGDVGEGGDGIAWFAEHASPWLWCVSDCDALLSVSCFLACEFVGKWKDARRLEAKDWDDALREIDRSPHDA